MVPTDEAPEGHVVEELQRGYRLRERLIRPAMVKVAAKKG
jgi:molecular chaperone GrpE